MKQHALTLIAEIDTSKLELLRAMLRDKNEELKIALRKLGTVHYCRWVIIDEKILDGETLAPQLAFCSNVDGTPEKHIQDLIDQLGSLLDKLYGHCVDYNPMDKIAYFNKIRVKEMAFYQGSPGRSIETIAKEKSLRNKLVQLKNEGHWKNESAITIHRALRSNILNDHEFAWASEKIETPSVNWPALIMFGIVQLAISPFIILWAIYMQVFHESRDKAPGLKRNQLDDQHITRMQLDEDFEYQNQFSQIIDMKPGKARLFTVTLLYYITRILIKILFVKGKLMGIPTIHFARWVMVNNKKRMLFFSNFDGSWTQYLGDFIDKSGWGLTGIFGNTKDFPKSLFLIFKGAYKQQEFLAWSRNSQIATQLWYVDDPSLSIKNINNNSIIRNELSKNLSERQAIKFLSRI